jgi:hypothetical protein
MEARNIDYQIRANAFVTWSGYAGGQSFDFSGKTFNQIQHGFLNPKYKDQIAHFQNAGTPYQRTVWNVKCHPGLFKYTVKLPLAKAGKIAYCYHMFVGVNSMNTNFINVDPSLVNRAISRFYSLAYNQQRLFKAGEYAGEFSHMLHNLRHPLGGLRDLLTGHNARILKAMKPSGRHRIKQADVLKTAADSWLEVRFGWKPLNQDLHQLFEDLAFRSLAPDTSFKIKFTTTGTPTYVRDDTNQVNISYTLGGDSVNGRLMTWLVKGQSVKVKGCIDLSMGKSIPFALGLDAPSFLPTLWELTPYSFVADYFGNVNQILEAYAVPRASIRYVNVMQRSNILYQATFVSHDAPAGGLGGETPGVTEVRGFQFVRNCYDGSTLATPQLAFTPYGSVIRLTNLSAIFSQLRNTSSRLSKIPH